MTILSEHKDRQAERLHFIEFVLLFMGRLQRSHLSERFGISNPAATKDLSLYNGLNPEFAAYDLKAKCYRYIGNAPPISNHTVEQSFYALSGHLPISKDFVGAAFISSSVGASIKRSVDIALAASLTRGIYLNKRMAVTYRSIRDGERERIISPLAIIHDGLRWHIRGYDHDQEGYNDYTLARFIAATEDEDSNSSLVDDFEWNKYVELQLVVHPCSEHPETVSLDYDIDSGLKTVKIRSCMVGYFLRRWPIDFSKNATENPNKKHLYLMNRNSLIKDKIAQWVISDK